MSNTWGVKNRKEQLYFDSKYGYKRGTILAVSFSIFGNVTDIWDIRKLTDKEMILETISIYNKHIRLKLQQK